MSIKCIKMIVTVYKNKSKNFDQNKIELKNFL